MTDKVTVVQGQIIVTDVDLISSSDSHRVWYIECHSKYMEVGAYGGKDVLLIAGEHTIKCDRDALPTVVTLPVPEGFELLPETHGRYSIRVAAYVNQGYTNLWDDRKEGKT